MTGVWWDWPLTWLTKHCPSLLCKIVYKMTHNLSSRTCNRTILISLTYLHTWLKALTVNGSGQPSETDISNMLTLSGFTLAVKLDHTRRIKYNMR